MKRATLFIPHKIQELNELLAKPVDASSLATFRILFGLIMVWEVIRFFYYDTIARYYIEPQFYFTYELVPFVSPWPGDLMYWHFFAMGLFALGIALGVYYRISSFLFFLAFTYVFLLDKTRFNNHFYLISLLAFLLIVVDAQRWASIDQWHGAMVKKRSTLSGQGGHRLDLEFVPFWNLLILRAQIFLVYFYGGIAKLNSDWLAGEPMRMWLRERADYLILGSFFTTEGATYLFSYGGLLFDMLIGFLLLWKPTRLLAFMGLLFFHLVNSWLFTIGVFPFLMIAATILFVEPDWPRRILRLSPHHIPPFVTSQMMRRQPWVLSFIGLYLAIQLLVPLRHWLYPGNVSWTEEGHRFSWHMKLRDKEGVIAFFVIDPKTNEIRLVNLRPHLTEDQINKMVTRPDMILQYTHYLAKVLPEVAGLDKPIIKVDSWVSLNGRPFQRLVDPNVDLAKIDADPFSQAPWILPLEEPLSPTPLATWLNR